MKYEIPGVPASTAFSIATGPFSFVSMDQFVVDTQWSPSGFASDTAIALPEPTSVALFGIMGLAVVSVRFRRTA